MPCCTCLAIICNCYPCDNLLHTGVSEGDSCRGCWGRPSMDCLLIPQSLPEGTAQNRQRQCLEQGLFQRPSSSSSCLWALASLTSPAQVFSYLADLQNSSASLGWQEGARDMRLDILLLLVVWGPAPAGCWEVGGAPSQKTEGPTDPTCL